MGVTRRAVVGGMLGGLGDALMQYGQTRVMRRQKAQEIADARAWEMEKARIQALSGLSSKIAEDPTQANTLLQGAAMNPLFEGLNLSRMAPPDAAIVAALQQKVAGVDKPEALPNPELVAQRAGLDTQPVAPAGPGAGSQFGFMAPSSSFEGTNPSVQPVQQAVIDRKNALRLAADEKIAQAGRQKQEESYGTATGTNQAKNENFPVELGQKKQEATELGPINATNAGLTAGAQFDAENTPQRQATRAQGAGRVAAAEAGARERARVQAEKEIRASGLSPQQQQAALQLSDNFRQESSRFSIVDENFRTILKASKGDSPQADLSMIFAYMRMLDPGSTVRDGEFARAEQTIGVPGYMQLQWEKVKSGRKLTPEQINGFVKMAFDQYQGQREGQQRIVTTYTDRALKMGVDPSLVVRQPDPELDKAPMPPQAGQTTPQGFRVVGARPAGAK